ncbi:hypothetical protein FHS95_002748 [Sphingomonas naasensis]|nr:hypothetical protein [Sphingomonas naasensis]
MAILSARALHRKAERVGGTGFDARFNEPTAAAIDEN